MSGKTDRRITFLSLTTAALPPDGSGVAWWLAWCGGRCFSGTKERSIKPKTFAFSRLYRHIRKPLMPIRYPIAFRGTARPSVCSAWRLKVPKIEHLTHPKPYIVSKLGAFPKPFACFSLICSSRNPRFSWNSECLCISVKPRLAFVISETCKPFSSLSAFSLFGATKAVLSV